MQTRAFFKNYLENNMLPLFSSLKENKAIEDSEIRRHFSRQATEILHYYQSAHLPVGNLGDYINAITQVNATLDSYSRTRFGYASLFKPCASYIVEKLAKESAEVPTPFKEALDLAKKNNISDVNGKKPLFQITSDAERDFMLLLIEYLKFFMPASNNLFTFTSKTINAGLKLPGASLLIKQRTKKFQARIDSYEKNQADYQQEDKQHNDVFLAFSKKIATDTIDEYIQKQSRLNFYGKNRAKELKAQIDKSTTDRDIRNIINDFIATGKTKSDHSCFSFFRGGPSGHGKHSLRTQFENINSGKLKPK